MRLILIFILLSGCARDFDINPTTTIVRQLFKASYDETRVQTLAESKKNTPKIQWTRLESWSSFGTPDLLGYHDNCGFFMVELKIATGKKIHFSPHQKLFHLTRKERNFILIEEASSSSIKLYESSSILGLLADYRETPSLAINDWDHIQRLLIREPLDA